MRKLVIGVAVFITAAYAAAAAATGDTLVANEYLFPPQQLLASGCFSNVPMQSDGNLVNYAGNNAVWASDTVHTGGYAVMQSDGNFVVYNWADSAVWSTHTNGHSGASVVIQDDGNLVVYSSTHRALWASNTNGESVGQSPCSRAQEKTKVSFNFDRPGGDFKTIIPNQARASWCGFFCAGDARCKAYTYVPPAGSGTGVCHLKSVIPALSSSTGMVSGAKLF